MNRKEFITSSGAVAAGLALFPLSTEGKSFRSLFGSRKSYDTSYDAIIVGGSYAGLSTGLTLARCLRKVLLIDAGQPRNQVAQKAHNALTMDGRAPDAIRQEAVDQLAVYKDYLHLLEEEVSDVTKSEHSFVVSGRDGQEFTANHVVFATGAKDRLPDIKGLKEQWGKHVQHCPYCHGFESRTGKTLLVVKDFKGLELLSSLNHWSESLTVAMQTATSAIPDQLTSFLEKQGIKWNTSLITEVVSDKEENLKHVIFEDGSKEPVDHIYLATEVKYRTEFAEKLGCEKDKTERIVTNDFMLTNQPRVYAVGDISSKSMGQIIWAANSGMMAGVHINNAMIASALK